MSEHDAKSEETIFSGALARPAGDRSDYLAAACAGRPALRERIENLLEAQPHLGEFMENPLETGLTGLDRSTFSTHLSGEELPGAQIGPYKLLQRIGEGGCGVVYMAEQEKPVRRRVAIKVIKLGMDTKSVIARFEAERQALAMMDHPNIAKVLDAGATETGRPYFVMELVRGTKITDFCDQNRLTTRERLDLFMQVCQAVQHAHQKGIIHRDLKPSNIPVTVHNVGAPGVPVIIDFGIAKATQSRLTDHTLFTAFEQFLGTPVYMSPEQTMLTALDIDTRSDIYSLGVLLYELLTGRTPFEGKHLLAAGLDEMRRTIQAKEPDLPSTRLRTLLAADQAATATHRATDLPRLVRLLRGDLDWIVMKCLEKDRSRRYQTAADLSQDLQRHLSSEPVLAGPASGMYRLRMFVRRNKLSFAAALAVAATLALGLFASLWQAVRATRAEQAATHSRILAEHSQAREHLHRELAEVRLYAADMYAAQQAFDSGNLGRARDLLKAHYPPPGEPDLRGFEWHYLWNICRGDNLHTFTGHDEGVRCVAYSPDGKLLASGGADRFVKLWDLRERTEASTLPHRTRVDWLAFSNDGAILATLGEGILNLWDSSSHELITTHAENNAARFAFSPVGTLIAIGYGHSVFGDPYGGSMKLWDYKTGQTVKTFPEPGARLAFSPDGKILAARSTDGSVKLWSAETGQEIRRFDEARDVYDLCFSPDGQTLAAVQTGKALVWDVRTGRHLFSFSEHVGQLWAVAFSRDGKTLVTGGNELRLWDLAAGKEEAKRVGHDSIIKSVSFAADGRSFATGGKDALVMLWSTFSPPPKRALTNVHHPPAFSPTSKIIATSRTGGPTTLWDAATRHPIWVLPGERMPWFSDSNILSTVSTNTIVRHWDVNSKTLLRSVVLPGVASSVPSSHLAQRNNRLAVMNPGGPITLYNAESGERLGMINAHPPGAGTLAFSPDTRLLVFFGEGAPVKIWHAETHQELVSHNVDGIHGLAFSPDSSLLVTGSWDETVRFINPWTGSAEIVLRGIKDGCSGVALSRDFRTLAVACEDGTVRLWNLKTRREVATLRHGLRPVRFVEFSPDSRTLVSVSADDETLRFWLGPDFGAPSPKRVDVLSPTPAPAP